MVSPSASSTSTVCVTEDSNHFKKPDIIYVDFDDLDENYHSDNPIYWPRSYVLK